LLLREWITTVIPSALSRRAVASPIPDVDPVINATAFCIPVASQTRRGHARQGPERQAQLRERVGPVPGQLVSRAKEQSG
jgi:hypothetical protein